MHHLWVEHCTILQCQRSFCTSPLTITCQPVNLLLAQETCANVARLTF